jgi:hypothetical protein
MGARGPGWPTVLGLLLVVVTFSVVNPLQLVLIPLVLLLTALPPRSPRALLVALAVGVLVFVGPRGTLWYVERGWSLLLAGWFIVAVVAWPRASFSTRAVAATAAAMVSAGVIVVAQGGWVPLDHTIGAHYREGAELVRRFWPGDPVGADVIVAWTGEIPARLFPALAAIGSVAALAVAWWLSGRVSGAPRRLGTLAEFRFPDPLVWVLIGGLVMVLVPLAAWAPRLGLNLVVFMGALYALRGLGVVVALVWSMVGSQLGLLLALGMVAIILYPIVVAGTLLLGVADTWLDLRSGRRAVNDEGRRSHE